MNIAVPRSVARWTLPLLTVAGFSLSPAVASADDAHNSSHPHPNHELHCSPGDVDSNFGHCTLTFKDEKSDGTPRFGQTVCFSASPAGAGSISGNSSGNCSVTDSKGNAAAFYTANGSFCGRVTVTGMESGGDADGSAQTVVKIKCQSRDNGASNAAAAIAHPSSPVPGGSVLVLVALAGASLIGAAGGRRIARRRR